MSKVKVLGVSGSPRKGKNTERLLQSALDAAVEAGAEAECLALADYRILCCDGCNVCVKEKRCPLDEGDDMTKISSKLVESNAIIFASPSYFGQVPGLMKNMMDRTRPLKMDGHRLRGKVASALALSALRYGGAEQLAESIVRFGLTHGMIIVGGLGDPLTSGYFGLATLQGDSGWRRVEGDSLALEDARIVGKRVVEVASCLKG